MSSDRLNKKHSQDDWKGKWRNLTFSLIFICAVLIGCTLAQSKQCYENPEFGLSFSYPKNWHLTFTKRNSLIVLEAQKGIVEKDSSRIEIQGYSCAGIPMVAGMQDPYIGLESNKNRIGMLYGLDSVATIQGPIETEEGDRKIIKTIIAIPVASMQDDLSRIEVDDQDELQKIAIFAITNDSSLLMAYIYEGNDDELNAEAEEIIHGIDHDCSGQP